MNDKKPRRKSWFIIIIGEKKRSGPFEITRLSLVVLAFVILIIISAMIIGSWLYNRACIRNSLDLSKNLSEAKLSLELATKENEKLSAEISNLAEKIKTIKNTSEQAKSSVVSVRKDTGNTDAISGDLVTIDDFTTNYDANDEKLSFQFIIKNSDQEGTAISGYAFAILKPALESENGYECYPAKAALVKGSPRFFKQGEFFSIARFKTIKGKFNAVQDMAKFASLSIIVYSNDGKLILKKEFPL